MKLLNNTEYRFVEKMLRNSYMYSPTSKLNVIIQELFSFFDNQQYTDFISIFYIERYMYKNRYANNRALFQFLSRKLAIPESTLYLMRREIVYKSAMLFYKHSLYCEEDNIDEYSEIN